MAPRLVPETKRPERGARSFRQDSVPPWRGVSTEFCTRGFHDRAQEPSPRGDERAGIMLFDDTLGQQAVETDTVAKHTGSHLGHRTPVAVPDLRLWCVNDEAAGIEHSGEHVGLVARSGPGSWTKTLVESAEVVQQRAPERHVCAHADDPRGRRPKDIARIDMGLEIAPVLTIELEVFLRRRFELERQHKTGRTANRRI